MKKIIALFLILALIFTVVACKGNEGEQTDDPSDAVVDPVDPADPDEPDPVTADQIPDTMTSDDGTYKIAFVTDVGQLKDKSFNQGTWDGCKLYAYNNGLSYKYYQPANGDQATDDDRYDAMKAAVDGGAEIIVCAGFMQGTALTQAAAEFTDVKFVFIDGWALSLEDGTVLENVAGIAFKEEQAGYLAGYAVVKEGYTKLGFTGGGGGTNPACCRYGYGFVLGAKAAAAELNVEVAINYSWQYGASFSASAELQTMANGWYAAGTEIIFACGGSMFSSVAAAAAENDAKVVGVDVDQSFESETVVTSAMKGLSAATSWSIEKLYTDAWADIGGQNISLGAAEDAVGLPTATWSLANWSVDEYTAVFNAMKDGSLVIDANYPEDITTASDDLVTITLI
ncbi:MAG: BMP family ABC transporter substrate-binding protein [Clostridia bacterium]|nr:BMP family ABC transporter substrate-binding protein [Clostridia bacterium]